MRPGELAESYSFLFQGRGDVYGTGAGRVVKAPLTIAAYRDHLAGRGEGLGVFPLRQDATVSFAAIDLDEPDYHLGSMMAGLLPGTAWIERTRSDNVHVWVFFDAPIEAWIARGVLRSATEAIGRPQTEIFPKQDRLRDEVSFGNYINLPLHGDTRPIVWRSGDADDFTPPGYALEDFVEQAHRLRTPPEAFRSRARALGITEPEQRSGSVGFGERAALHECAARIYRERETNPLVEGSRDVVLFNFAKQVLNWELITPAEAREMVDEVNAAAMPPLPRHEVDRLFRNALEKRYTSTGCDDPMMVGYVDPDCPIAKGLT